MESRHTCSIPWPRRGWRQWERLCARSRLTGRCQGTDRPWGNIRRTASAGWGGKRRAELEEQEVVVMNVIDGNTCWPAETHRWIPTLDYAPFNFIRRWMESNGIDWSWVSDDGGTLFISFLLLFFISSFKVYTIFHKKKQNCM